MKRVLMCCGLILAAVALLGAPRDAAGCSRCDPGGPRCQTANYSRCYVYAYSKTITVCEQEYADCAWVYTPAEVSADGTVATLATNMSMEPTSGGQVRGCHGLVVDRNYAATRKQQARSASREIVL